ncbi:MAG: glycosyltransferase, partial [Planctomycetota bacterium]
MRILQLNWARIWHGVAEGGGVNGYCQWLALAFTRQGHEVSTLASGRTYSPDPEQPSAIGPTHIVRHDDWLGIRCFEIVNSPVLAPSSWQFADPEPEIESEAMNEAVAGLLEKLEPDLVHVHSLEGFGAGVIDVVRRAGCPVVMSLHNYHTICPEVFLLHGDRELCFDDEGGLR